MAQPSLWGTQGPLGEDRQRRAGLDTHQFCWPVLRLRESPVGPEIAPKDPQLCYRPRTWLQAQSRDIQRPLAASLSGACWVTTCPCRATSPSRHILQGCVGEPEVLWLPAWPLHHHKPLGGRPPGPRCQHLGHSPVPPHCPGSPVQFLSLLGPLTIWSPHCLGTLSAKFSLSRVTVPGLPPRVLSLFSYPLCPGTLALVSLMPWSPPSPGFLPCAGCNSLGACACFPPCPGSLPSVLGHCPGLLPQDPPTVEDHFPVPSPVHALGYTVPGRAPSSLAVQAQPLLPLTC